MHAMGQLIKVARALERSSPGSAFAPLAAAAAANVTAALQQLLLKVRACFEDAKASLGVSAALSHATLLLPPLCTCRS